MERRHFHPFDLASVALCQNELAADRVILFVDIQLALY